MMRQEPTAAAATVVICGNCGIEERRLLHHVRHRGIFRRLCTTCVLRLHPQFFCPTCFLVYERSSPPDSVTCFKCYSSSHPNCVSTPTPSKTPYICPSCVSPNIPIFSLKKIRDEGSETEICKAIDKKGAKILLAAARIASITMNKAAVAARAEAERRAKEAAFTKKRAREALENLVYLMAKEKKKNQKAGITSSLPLVRGEPRVDGRSAVDRVDRSGEVLAALNAVELKERVSLQVPKVETAVSEVVSGSLAVAMEVDDSERMGITSAFNNENEKSANLGNLDESENVEGEKSSSTLLSAPLVDQPQSEKSSQPMGENIGLQQ